VVTRHVHELLTAPDLSDLIDAAANIDLDPWQRANLAEMRRKQVHAAAVEPALVAALSRAAAAGEARWKEAKAAADFSIVRPAFAEILNLVRETANLPPRDIAVTNAGRLR
jgi:carboxypeptidase Taq